MARPHAKGMHREEIKAKLRMKFGSLRRAATEFGVHYSAISRVFLFPNDSRPVELKIARALDLSPHLLWPDRWTAAGEPLPRAGKSGEPVVCDHRKNGGAA